MKYFRSLLAVVLAAGLLAACHVPEEWILGDVAEIDGPTSGPAWEFLQDQAATSLTPNLSDQGDLDAAHTFAAALVYARTGDTAYRDKVWAALDALPGTLTTVFRNAVLSVGRQLPGYVLAADLTDYQGTEAWITWLNGLPTAEIGSHDWWKSLKGATEHSANNWTANALAARASVYAYFHQTDNLAEVAQLLRGWLGDRTSYVWTYETSDFDVAWACDYPDWTPVNAADCGDIQGAIVEDISRGDTYPNPEGLGWTYTGESMQGLMLTALILEHNGYPDVWTWGDSALRRTHEFVDYWGGTLHSINNWTEVLADQKYGTSFADDPAGHGRGFGFNDWLNP